eukprot:GILI01029363.1.p1 GENE.GILI01029363.1~~GILI01029363.1.p1  ORF type:complete len:249 (+),score=77.38 GILI01029363.1:72-818(+)
MLRRSLFILAPTFTEILMPALSPSMESGTILKWNLQAGSKITQGTSICSLQTDKAVVSFDHQMDDGFLAKTFAKEGDSVEVGKLIAVMVEEEADVAKADEFKPKSAPVAAAAAAPPTPAKATEAPPTLNATEAAAPTSSAFSSIADAIAASGPAVGRIAREVGEGKLKEISPSGKNGRFTKSDLISLEGSAPAPTSAEPKKAAAQQAGKRSLVVAVNPGKVYDFSVSDARILAKLIARSPVAKKKATA